MKQKIGYSRATGALLILVSLFIVVCFFDASWLMSWNRTHDTSFGKTHFIVGYDQHTVAQAATSPQQAAYTHILFSPDDDLQQELVKLIRHEKKGIKVAIFTFTDKVIAQELIDAHKRGVKIEVITDASYLRDQYSKIALLQHAKIPVYTYNPHYKNMRQKKTDLLSIMHNKFVVFLNNIDNKSLVWTGSFNFTRSAILRNQENVIILDDSYAIKKYMDQFSALKHRCDNCAYEHDVVIA